MIKRFLLILALALSPLAHAATSVTISGKVTVTGGKTSIVPPGEEGGPPFTFTVSLPSATWEVDRSTSANASAVLTVNTGTAESVEWTTSGEQSGITIGFTPTTCTGDCTATVLITATGAATLSTATVTVTGCDVATGLNCSSDTVDLTVNAAAGTDFTAPGALVNLSDDGNFAGATDLLHQGPQVCADNASLIFAHMTNNTTSGQTDKSIIITKRGPTGTLTSSNIATVPSTDGNQIHQAPFVKMLASGKILVIYRAGLSGAAPKYRVSTSACDITAWSAEASITGLSNNFQFAFGEITTAGVYRLIGQAASAHMGYIELAADDSTWQNVDAELITGTGSAVGGPQPHATGKNGDRMGITWTSGNASGCNRGVHFAYTLDGNTFRNAANSVTFTRAGGLTGSSFTDQCSGVTLKRYASYEVRQGRNDQGPRVVLLSDDTPVILSNDASNIRIHKWTGSAWSNVNVAAGSTSGHSLVLLPSGKLVIINITSTYNIVAYTSTDAGATWSAGTTIHTKGSEGINRNITGTAQDPDNVVERVAIMWSRCFNTTSATPTNHCKPTYLDYAP